MVAMTDEILTVVEVAAYLKMHRGSVQKWCKEGRLPAAKIGKEYRVRRSDLDRWYEGFK